ncbi:flavodoxin family protein [Nocardioides daphniae]|uniref:Flavodoxin n=1 Tax=Nocardioides daphniae TaxID=402297 RepID=A0A4P7UE73_9ACTN|nr:flavodoxin family protein [Nocardioides daphniae]QCC77648.1 flavodoxin family protein [Nocardioides daphniae]GGD29820.1 flavodoxin [Nocardioides daphniae]
MESNPPRLLVVHHSPTASSRALTDAALTGTRLPELAELGPLEVVVREALEATADDVRGANGLLLGTPANFGYMSGALKHFFDSTFLHLGGALGSDGQGSEGQGDGAAATGAKLPYALWVHGRYDTVGATRSVESIAQALPWRRVLPPLELLGDVDDDARAAATELGATVAAMTLESR